MTLVPSFPELTINRPLWFGHSPGDEQTHFVVEQSGQIIAFDIDAPENARVFFERSVYRDNNEEGLLGLAFHPSYQENGRLFVFYSMSNPRRSVISEYIRNVADPLTVDPTSERVILEVQQPFGNHNGGDLRFGPDGYLYISLGDGGAAADPFGHGQNKDTLLGSILRIDIDATDPGCGTPYGIPSDNPFATERCQPGVSPIGAPEIWAWGLRNVWRMSFDRGTGLLWAGDVGQDAREEIDLIVGGQNYGWNQMEGDICFREPCIAAEYAAPVHTYGHDEGKSITGGFVYRGGRLPELWGQYIFGDYETGRVWALDVTSEAVEPTLLALSRSRISSFGESSTGEVYVVTFDRGILSFERSRARDDVPPIPETLSETGCFNDTASYMLAPGVYPYDVRVPLWSDGLEKIRAIALPVGQSSTLKQNGSISMPVGGVTLKTFLQETSSGETRRIETRIIRRDDRGWNGYSYLWREDQSDADLLRGRTEVTLESEQGPQQWTIPSRSECDHCHIDRQGYSLGLTQRQLDFDLEYESGVLNQLDALIAAGLVTPMADVPRGNGYPSLADEDSPLAVRTRALLDTNCAPCHQPDGPADAEIDLRYETPLPAMNICDVAPQRGDVDIPDAALMTPGDPGHSLILRRMQIRTKGQMPPLGSHRADPVGTGLVSRWIAELTDCAPTQERP